MWKLKCGTWLSQDAPVIDNSETVYISSLALLKMLRHGRAGWLPIPPPPVIHPSKLGADNDAIGVPMEVMGLMLGEFVDDYTVRVVDVRSPLYPSSHFFLGGEGGGEAKGKEKNTETNSQRSLLCPKAEQECQLRLWIPFSRRK